MVWGYFIILPFLWSDILGRWAFPERAAMCAALFGSGFITLLGGLSAGHAGFGLIERARLDRVGTAVRPLPVEARFAAWPTFNDPILLQGRKAVMGYPGHLWTEGFDYNDLNNRLNALMNGAPNWREAAQSLGVRYVFWGQDEKANYQASTRPWEATAFLVASGDWGAIYDLAVPAPLKTSDYAEAKGPGAVFWICNFAVIILVIASNWKVFSKAGQPGWAAIIPIYNVYVMCKVAGRPGWWLLLFLIPLVNFIIAIILNVDIAKHFGKGIGFAIGMILLPFIFWPILGFGSARYQSAAPPPMSV